MRCSDSCETEGRVAPKRSSAGLLFVMAMVLIFTPVWSNYAVGMLPESARKPLRAIENDVVATCQPMLEAYDRVPYLGSFYEWCFDRVY